MPNRSFSLINANVELSRRNFFMSAAALALSKHATVQAGGEKLLLVCGANSTLSSELTKSARKIFLGIPLIAHEEVVTPIMNASAVRTRELFLQRVLYMSAEVFERHQQAKIYRNSGQRIPESTSVSALIALLNKNPCHLSYILAPDLPNEQNVRVLGTL
jgi:hypothetical protein